MFKTLIMNIFFLLVEIFEILTKNIEFSNLLKGNDSSNIIFNESFDDQIVLTNDSFIYYNLNLTNIKREKIQINFENGTIYSFYSNNNTNLIFDNFHLNLNNTLEKLCFYLENSGSLIIKVNFI